MSPKLDKYLMILTICAIVLANTALGFAESEMESFTLEADITETGQEPAVDITETGQEPAVDITETGQEPAVDITEIGQGLTDEAFGNDFEEEITASGKETTAISEFEAIELELTQAQQPAEDFENTALEEAAADLEAEAPLLNIEKQEAFVDRLKTELNLSKTDYRQVLNTISDAKAKLKTVSEEKLNLQEQLANINNLIDVATEKLINVIKQIIAKENEIALLYEQIEIREIAVEYQKDLLKDYIRIIYEEENNYFSIGEEGEIQAFKLLLAEGSVGTNLMEIKYFDLLNEAGQQMIDRLEELMAELQAYEKELTEQKARLLELQTELEEEKAQLQLQKESKEKLLELTQGQEEIFSQLLEQTTKEQEQLLNDVRNLSNALFFIQNKIAEEGENFNPDDYLKLLDYRTQALYNFQISTYGIDAGDFVWPVDPERGISAYFHDSGYAGSFGVQHNAIDLPEYQGSPVRAAADGVVYTARDNGYGYSYIILAHAGGFMTVYGHISNMLVAEGDIIAQGSIIGLSGGMPGSYGAGYMTTGPHLHFEALLNGMYVDPLDYLPLEVLTKDQIKAIPDKYYDNWEKAVFESNLVPIER